MKKNLLLLPLVFLASCSIRVGDYDILRGKGFKIDLSDSYSAGVYGKNKLKLLKSEYVEERNFKVNENQMAARGASVINNKVYRKDFYVKDELMANKDAWLHSASVPLKIYKNKAVKVLGVVDIEGNEYRLVESDMNGFVFLVDNDGHVLNKMGRLKDEKLTLMPTEYVITPDDVLFRDVVKSSTIQSRPIRGFEIKYDGIKAGRMWFTYLDYDDNDSEGKFKQYNFPAKPGLIEIKGIGIRVMAVDDNKIEYMVVKYQ